MSRRASRSKPNDAESIFVMWPLIEPLDFSVRGLPDTLKRLTTGCSHPVAGDPGSPANWAKSTHA